MKANRILSPIALLAILILGGCSEWNWWKRESPTTRPAGTLDASALRPANVSPATTGTVGSVSYLQGGRFMRVRGWGIVRGLGTNGSRNCRPGIREYIIKEIRRANSANPRAENRPDPERFLESLDTAVVEVTADIPAGARKGRTFDVMVRADDPDTKSLAGGYLMSCELKIFREVSAAESIEGRTHARAEGPIFMNPFLSGATTQPATFNPNEGRVLGGGVNLLDRRLSLVSTIESYATVRQVMDSINRRFESEDKIADAVSPTNVELNIPPKSRVDQKRFLELVMHLPLTSSPAAREARGRLLVAELKRPDAPLEDTALSLEGVGSLVIPMLQPLYTDVRRPVNYYAARTGLRLGDEAAIDVVIRHATDTRSPYRLQAARELGDCTIQARAAAALRELLRDTDARIRILAYEGIRKVDPPSVERYVLGRRPLNFLLEVVPSDGPTMIYARRTEVRRLALIGGDRMAFRPPLLYASPNQPITLRANLEDRSLVLLRKNVGGRNIGPMEVPLSVVPIIKFMGDDLATDPDGRLQGLGLDYSVVLDVLYRLCEKKAINADLRWEEPSVEEIVGPLGPMGRPESEL